MDQKTTTDLKVAGAGVAAVGGAMTATVVLAIPGVVVAAVGGALSLAAGLFGSKYNTSTGVRWLVQMYQYFVLGQNVTSDNKVDESLTTAAQQWFSYALGVPIFDKYRWHALEGSDPETDAPLNNSDTDRVNQFMKFPEIATWAQQITDPYGRVMNAVQIVKTMNDRGQPGSWGKILPADYIPPTTGILTGSTNSSLAQAAQNAFSNPKENWQLWVLAGAGVVMLVVTIVVVKKVLK